MLYGVECCSPRPRSPINYLLCTSLWFPLTLDLLFHTSCTIPHPSSYIATFVWTTWSTMSMHESHLAMAVSLRSLQC
jgi:hypothetical protein